jgi:hypothetical protein
MLVFRVLSNQLKYLSAADTEVEGPENSIVKTLSFPY